MEEKNVSPKIYKEEQAYSQEIDNYGERIEFCIDGRLISLTKIVEKAVNKKIDELLSRALLSVNSIENS